MESTCSCGVAMCCDAGENGWSRRSRLARNKG